MSFFSGLNSTSEIVSINLLNLPLHFICLSGFGQKEGRVGFRTTFLPQEEELEFAIGEFKRHHELFCDKYA